MILLMGYLYDIISPVKRRLRDLKIPITANKVIRPSEMIFSDSLSNGITSPLSPA